MRAIVEAGYDHISGPVARVGDLPAPTPGELLERWQLDPDRAPYQRAMVYLSTFAPHQLMELKTPTAAAALGELDVYATGFLRGATIVPVWLLTRTRVNVGATVWRLTNDRQPEPILRYGGPATGWHGAKAYVPPNDFVGVRADVDGTTYPAELAADGSTLDLVAVQADQPAGFEPVRPHVWHRQVPVTAASRVWDLSLLGTYQGVPCRVISRRRESLVLQLAVGDPGVAATVGARHIDVGVFELEVPKTEVQLGDGIARELPQQSA